MKIPLRKALGFGLIAAVSVLAVTPPAWSDDKKDDRRGQRDGRHDRRDYRNDHRDRVRDQHREWERRREAERRHHEWERRRAAERQHHEWRRAAERREWERRRDFDRHRAAAHWRFEHNRGWRWEHRPGFWSPFFVWWRIDGRPFLRPYPTDRIVRYPTGYYELVGDGITVPFYWVWRPTAVVVAPPPVPGAPAVPPGYEIPTGYPPPPTS
jgi:hypothetical protein